MANGAERRAVQLQLLDAEGNPTCKGTAIVWATPSRGGTHWGGEFFQLDEGELPLAGGPARIRDRHGHDYSVVAGPGHQVSSGGHRLVRLRFGGLEQHHP